MKSVACRQSKTRSRYRLEAVAHQVLLLGDSVQTDESKRLRTSPPSGRKKRIQIMVVTKSGWPRSLHMDTCYWLLSARSTSALRPRLLYSRKTVGLGRARDTDDCVHTAHLARRTALAEFIGKMLSKHVLNDDSGSTLKATTVLGIRVQTHPTRGPASAITTPTPNPCSAHRQIPPRTSCQGIYRPPGRSDLGSCVRALVQRRVSTQRHPVRQHWAAPLRRRSTDPGGSTRPLLQSRKRNQAR